MFYMWKKEKYPAYVSKNNSNREKQVIFLMIPNEEKREAKAKGWRLHYLAVKKLSSLLRRITSKNSNFYCLICLNSFRTKNKLELHKKVCENKVFCTVIMPYEDTILLEFNQYQKSDKAPFIIYADLECIIERTDECKNNPENPSTTKVSKHIPSGCSMSAASSFRSIENTYDLYRGKDWMKSLCEFLREQAIKIINFKNKKIRLSTKGQQESYKNAKICCILFFF